jgi:hypothetical protein
MRQTSVADSFFNSGATNEELVGKAIAAHGRDKVRAVLLLISGSLVDPSAFFSSMYNASVYHCHQGIFSSCTNK